MTIAIENVVQEVNAINQLDTEAMISKIVQEYLSKTLPVNFTAQAANETSVVSPDTSIAASAEPATEVTATAETFDESLKRYNAAFESLIERRAKYDSLLNKHSDVLYSILTDCLALCIDPQHSDPESALRQSLDLYRAAKNAKRKIQSNATFESVIVRFVFDEAVPVESESISRSQASVYSTVLRKAIEANVAPTEFAAWVKMSGGVDKIRREREENEEQKSVALDVKTAEHFKNAAVIAEVKDANLSSIAEKNDGVDVVLIARQFASGQIAIIEVIRDDKIVNSVKKNFVKSLD
jgi:hypothetical protein